MVQLLYNELHRPSNSESLIYRRTLCDGSVGCAAVVSYCGQLGVKTCASLYSHKNLTQTATLLTT